MPRPSRAAFGRLLVIVTCIGAAFAAQDVGAASGSPVIQPGARITMGADGCTANWVYRGKGELAGQQFLGTARHCVSHVGQPVYLTDGPFPVSFARGLLVGKVAYISKALDFSLIRIDPSNFKYVDPAMAGHPAIPQGAAVQQGVSVNDLCQFSGHGVGFDGIQETEQSRVGLLAFMGRNQQYCNGPVTNGDSGGPVADTTAGNIAIGIVDTLGADSAAGYTAVGEGGVAMPGLLADAAQHGFPVSLRTVSH
jgi:hypothetical protein